MKRGDVIIVAPPGEFGKPRPAVVVQSDLALPATSITYLMITGQLAKKPDIRIPIEPTPENGLQKPSEIMVDLIQTSTRARIREIVGEVDESTMAEIDRALITYLGLTKLTVARFSSR